MHSLVSRILQSEPRAVARALTMVENDAPDKRDLLRDLYSYSGRAHIVGFTGSPGAGKSTLVDSLLTYLRKQDLRVGVLAVDPSSPFTGGALLGDRVRMTKHSLDTGVFIRSVGSRGSMGGIGKSTREMIYVLEASGCDVILLETVGVGQAELDIMTVADSVALVVTPGAGDDIQAAKAGIMEIADVFVVNKCDLPGADTLVRELEFVLREKPILRENWLPPIVRTKASVHEGTGEVWAALQRHRHHLQESGYWHQRRLQRHRQETLKLIEAVFQGFVEDEASRNPRWQRALDWARQPDPYASADEILKDMPWIREPLDNPLQP